MPYYSSFNFNRGKVIDMGSAIQKDANLFLRSFENVNIRMMFLFYKTIFKSDNNSP